MLLTRNYFLEMGGQAFWTGTAQVSLVPRFTCAVQGRFASHGFRKEKAKLACKEQP